MNREDHVPFQGNTLIVITRGDGLRLVPITPLADAFGVRPHGLRKRAQDDPAFNPTDICLVATDGKRRQMVAIPFEEVLLLIAGIRKSSNPEINARLTQYKKECMFALNQYFMPYGTPEEMHRLLANISGQLERMEQQADKDRREFAEYRESSDQRFQANEQKVESLEHEYETMANILHMFGIDHKKKEEIMFTLNGVIGHTGMDGRAIAGHVRKTMGSISVYKTGSPDAVLAILRDMLNTHGAQTNLFKTVS